MNNTPTAELRCWEWVTIAGCKTRCPRPARWRSATGRLCDDHRTPGCSPISSGGLALIDEARRLADLLELKVVGNLSGVPLVTLHESDAREAAESIRGLLARLQRAEAERSALIGQRIIEYDHGRGWWAYAAAPEDAQGWPAPAFCLTWDEAVEAVLTTPADL